MRQNTPLAATYKLRRPTHTVRWAAMREALAIRASLFWTLGHQGICPQQHQEQHPRTEPNYLLTRSYSQTWAKLRALHKHMPVVMRTPFVRQPLRNLSSSWLLALARTMT